MLTQEQIVKIINDDETYDERQEILRYEESETFEVDGHTFKHVDRYGGKGLGEEYWVIFSVSNDKETTYWKVPGFYQSHYGAELEWSDIFEVKSVEKTVTVWEAL